MYILYGIQSLMQLRDNTNIWLQEAKLRIFLKNSLVSVVLNDITQYEKKVLNLSASGNLSLE